MDRQIANLNTMLVNIIRALQTVSMDAHQIDKDFGAKIEQIVQELDQLKTDYLTDSTDK